jgi:hypothetical protein
MAVDLAVDISVLHLEQAYGAGLNKSELINWANYIVFDLDDLMHVDIARLQSHHDRDRFVLKVQPHIQYVVQIPSRVDAQKLLHRQKLPIHKILVEKV